MMTVQLAMVQSRSNQLITDVAALHTQVVELKKVVVSQGLLEAANRPEPGARKKSGEKRERAGRKSAPPAGDDSLADGVAPDAASDAAPLAPAADGAPAAPRPRAAGSAKRGGGARKAPAGGKTGGKKKGARKGR
jgi:hypothetical protein